MRAFLLLLLGGLLGGGVAAGNRLYRAGQYEAAAQEYAEAAAAGDTSATLRYGLGTALLRLGRWDAARRDLEHAAAPLGGAELRFRAHYNAGNADLEPAFRAAAGDTAREERLRRAITHYRQALLIRPGDADAKWNLELALRLLRRSGGGGGGGADESEGAGGQGDQDEAPSGGEGQDDGDGDGDANPAGGLTRSQAERLLAGADDAERELQRRRLKQAQPKPAPGTRDW